MKTIPFAMEFAIQEEYIFNYIFNMFKVTMTRNFVWYFLDWIAKITRNHNRTTLVEFLNCGLCRDILIMKKIQRVISRCILTFEKASFTYKNSQTIADR